MGPNYQEFYYGVKVNDTPNNNYIQQNGQKHYWRL